MNAPNPDVEALLLSVAQGDLAASEQLFPLVYDTLHRIASGYMGRERDNHTLQPTALIHEAFLNLVGHEQRHEPTAFQNLDHFISTAAKVMRQILVNHAKAKSTLKRGGNSKQIQLDEMVAAFEERTMDLVALDEAMERLAELDPQQHQLVELHFFGGMTIQQCSEFLGISERAAYYEWAHARSWLKLQIAGTPDE